MVQQRKIIVITHHAPTLRETGQPQHVENPWTSAFATYLLDAADWSGVALWVYGHTHFTSQFSKGGVKVVSNQSGYVLAGRVQEGRNRKDKTCFFDVGKVVYV